MMIQVRSRFRRVSTCAASRRFLARIRLGMTYVREPYGRKTLRPLMLHSE
jgi:hypothetical protein